MVMRVREGGYADTKSIPEGMLALLDSDFIWEVWLTGSLSSGTSQLWKFWLIRRGGITVAGQRGNHTRLPPVHVKEQCVTLTAAVSNCQIKKYLVQDGRDSCKAGYQVGILENNFIIHHPRSFNFV
jgi:hypothetical protein